MTTIADQSSFNQYFDAFVQQYIGESNQDNQGLTCELDDDWPSPCVVSNDDKLTYPSQSWQPYLRASREYSASNGLQNIEQALETSIPQALQDIFCRYFSRDLNAKAEQGNLVLLQAWNQQDFERLQKNVIAHVLMKRKLKQADTIFFALTDEEDFLLSVLLETGEVVLEEVGKEPHKIIAPSLTDFIRTITPLPQRVEW